MSQTSGFDSDGVSRGDRIEQIGPIGLFPLSCQKPYVLDVYPDGVVASEKPEGPPILDFAGQPWHLPLQKFRRLVA